GIPVGIIAVEMQTAMQVIPTDPGQLDSQVAALHPASRVAKEISSREFYKPDPPSSSTSAPISVLCPGMASFEAAPGSLSQLLPRP
ncbi:hypothetical protein SELMODRAFT_104838, partial [Selaginella moellendorffii]